MKLLVFAHTPPPHHGQSQMVKLMLEGLSKERDLELHHVNARLSRELKDIGGFQAGKIFRLLGYCLQAIWCRFRHGVKTFYYIPAPGKRTALYRDWLALAICRPFFPKIIFHWHAAGLAEWLDAREQRRLRPLTHRLFRNAAVSIVLSHHNLRDAREFSALQIKVVPNGIPDPCPAFDRELLSHRRQRFAERAEALAGRSRDAVEIKVLFLAHCTAEKGLFDTLDAIALANTQAQRAWLPMKFRLNVAGDFISPVERAEFDERIRRADLIFSDGTLAAQHIGFVSGVAKHRAFMEADCYCFPTYYHAESFGLTLIEAMAYGLPVLTTRWRSLPEILPPNFPGLVPVRSPEAVAAGLLKLHTQDSGEALRRHFQENFTVEKHLATLAEALQAAER